MNEVKKQVKRICWRVFNLAYGCGATATGRATCQDTSRRPVGGESFVRTAIKRRISSRQEATNFPISRRLPVLRESLYKSNDA